MPTSVPPPDGEVVGVGAVMDLDEGDDPQLCLGGVAGVLPAAVRRHRSPTGTGPPSRTPPRSPVRRAGAATPSGHLRRRDVHVTRAGQPAHYDPPAPTDDPFATPCDEPAVGGPWSTPTVSASRTRTRSSARRPSCRRTPARSSTCGATTRQARRRRQRHHRQRAGDRRPEGAEAALREVWGGGLCVSSASTPRQSSSRSRTTSRAYPVCSAAARSSTSSMVDVV